MEVKGQLGRTEPLLPSSYRARAYWLAGLTEMTSSRFGERFNFSKNKVESDRERQLTSIFIIHFCNKN